VKTLFLSEYHYQLPDHSMEAFRVSTGVIRQFFAPLPANMPANFFDGALPECAILKNGTKSLLVTSGAGEIF